MVRPASILLSLLICQSGFAQQALFPGYSATRTHDVLPGYAANPAKGELPGVAQRPIAGESLASVPLVLTLGRLDPAQMSASDNEVVANLSAELSKAAALSDFDISRPGWGYQQIVCPAFPDYVFLSFNHGADESGSSRFAALLPRNSAQVRILSTFSHGVLPFDATWNRPGTFEVFNGLLRQERGKASLAEAHNWLLIGLCYAELTGHPVQVLNPAARPGPTLDTLRLGANQPQMTLAPDQSATVSFSDVSRPAMTTNWSLHFDRQGQLTSVSHDGVRQSSSIALKP